MMGLSLGLQQIFFINVVPSSEVFQPLSMVCISIIILHSYMLQIHGGPLCPFFVYCSIHLCFDFLWVLIMLFFMRLCDMEVYTQIGINNSFLFISLAGVWTRDYTVASRLAKHWAMMPWSYFFRSSYEKRFAVSRQSYDK